MTPAPDAESLRLLNHPDSSVAQAVTDDSLTIRWSNRRFRELFHLDGEPAEGTLPDIADIRGHDGASILRLLRNEETGRSFEGECEARFFQDPALHAHVQILPLADGGYWVCLRDISRAYRENLEGIFNGLLQASRMKDNDTGNHIDRVNRYSAALARHLFEEGDYLEVTRDFVDTISFLAAMHDVGKIGIPDDILNKNGPLEDWEWEIMKTHCLNGVYILSSYPDPMAVEIVRSHHERWDGSGYPYGLMENMIPVSARIVSIADVYDALRSRRSYKDPMGHAQAKELVLLGRGTQFDPDLVDCFGAIEGEFEEIFDGLADTIL